MRRRDAARAMRSRPPDEEGGREREDERQILLSSHSSLSEQSSKFNKCKIMAARRKAQQPARLRCQANARERDRTLSVNTAFTALRTLIPTEPADRKLSKIETLKLATSYIKHLLSLLIYDGVNDRRIPCNETWTDANTSCCFCTRRQYHSNKTSKVLPSASKSDGPTCSLVPCGDMSHCH